MRQISRSVDHPGKEVDVKAVIRILRNEEPDIIVLQEFARSTPSPLYPGTKENTSETGLLRTRAMQPASIRWLSIGRRMSSSSTWCNITRQDGALDRWLSAFMADIGSPRAGKQTGHTVSRVGTPRRDCFHESLLSIGKICACTIFLPGMRSCSRTVALSFLTSEAGYLLPLGLKCSRVTFSH